MNQNKHLEQALNLTIDELTQQLAQEKRTKFLILAENVEKDQRIAELEAANEALKKQLDESKEEE